MSQKFHAAVHQRDDVSYVKLSGVIDEDNELVELTERIPGGGTVVIDLGDVERINSCGVRDWVNWLSTVEAKPADIVLVECSPAIVAQINLVNNFTGSGGVKSFYIPYFCPECDGEKVLLAEAVDMGPPPHEPPTCRCDECDQPMDFDDMPDSYFAFLANQKAVPKDEQVQGVLSEFQQSGDSGEKSRIRSRVGSGSGVGSGPKPSLPSVPSLPSISRTGLGAQDGSAGSNPGLGTGASRSPNFASMSSIPDGAALGVNQQANKTPTLIYVLVVVLFAAIGVLAYFLVTG